MSRRILIADDDSAYALAFKELLSSRDFEVYITDNVEDARELLSIQRFDVVVTDFRLGGDSDEGGCELVKFLKSSYPWIKAIVASEGATPQQMVWVYDQGADLYIEKPFRIERFLSALRALGAYERGIIA